MESNQGFMNGTPNQEDDELEIDDA